MEALLLQELSVFASTMFKYAISSLAVPSSSGGGTLLPFIKSAGIDSTSTISIVGISTSAHCKRLP